MNKEQALEYLATGGQHCPYCGSVDIECGEYEGDWDMVWCPVTCHDCKRSWQEDYILNGVSVYDAAGNHSSFTK